MRFAFVLCAFVLAPDSSGPARPDEPLLVALQIPGPGAADAHVTFYDWAGRRRWSVSLRPPALPDGGHLLDAGTTIWASLRVPYQGEFFVVLDKQDGKERFRLSGRFLGAPVTERGRLIVFFNDASGITAHDPATGTVVWTRKDIVPLPQVGAMCGRHLVVPSGDQLHALNAATGMTLWKVPNASAPLVEDGGLIWLAGPPVRGIVPLTGVEKRRIEMPEGGKFLTFGDGKAFFFRNGDIEARSLADGRIVWVQVLGAAAGRASVSARQGIATVNTFGPEGIHFLESSTGRPLSSYAPPPASSASFCMETRGIFRAGFMAKPGTPWTTELFDVHRGRSLWSGPAEAVWASTSGHELYVRHESRLRRIETSPGTAAWTIPFPEKPWGQLAGRGRTALATGDRIACFDAAMGGKIWEASLPVSGRPGSVLGAWPVP